MNPIQAILVLGVRAYQWTLSPVLRFVFGPQSGCRYTPSCSDYALDAICMHGALAGGWLALRRIGRCHPWGSSGHDPVPEKTQGARRKAEGRKRLTLNDERSDMTVRASRIAHHATRLNSHPSTLNPGPARHGS